MNEDLLNRAAELDGRGETFALATVVAVDRPVSATPGDRAIVSIDGRVAGWVGGSCSEPIVVRESLAAIADGQPRLVRIRPPGGTPESPRPGVVTEITTCASEGGVDVFVEPRRPRPRLLLAGSSPVARRLATLAPQVGYRPVGVFDAMHERLPGVDSRASIADLAEMQLGAGDAVVVATMNRYDEHALEAALATGAGYVGLVASRVRWDKARSVLASMGVAEEALARVRAPAG
ncbi:MAG: XdhC family protein, partial [Actinomycetota bacterium]